MSKASRVVAVGAICNSVVIAVMTGPLLNCASVDQWASDMRCQRFYGKAFCDAAKAGEVTPEEAEAVLSSRRGMDASSRDDEEQLMIFGGKGHKTYLGCLCGADHPDSVFNSAGRFGGGFTLEPSLFGSLSDFRSRFGDYSACNHRASDAPVVVDRAGHFYGRLNATDPLARRPAVAALLERVCGM